MLTRLCVIIAVLAAPPVARADTAEYEIVFEGIWNANHATRPFPIGAHFTTLIGDTHAPDAAFWKGGSLATLGVENVAETGSTGALASEIEDRIAAEISNVEVRVAGLSGFPAEASTTFLIEPDRPEITVMSMVAPTPDWFVGVSGLSLRDGEGWISELSVDLMAYDAGTEDGDAFSLANLPTNPHELIAHRGAPFKNGAVIARLHFTRLPEPDPLALQAALLLVLGALRRSRQ